MTSSQEYIFGYGSLIDRTSRTMTWPDLPTATPVIVRGIRRGWFDQIDAPGYSPTFLGAMLEPASTSLCNGVIFAVSADQLAAFDTREQGYQRRAFDPATITMLDGSSAPPAGRFWVYTTTSKRLPSPEIPIVQSYVDVCLSGCLEIEATYPMAREHEFSRMFLRTTSDWSQWWVNDRLYPRRPFVHQPNAYAIDRLIKQELGDELFRHIQIEPPQWNRP